MKSLLITLVLLCSICEVRAQVRPSGLHRDALIVETQKIPTAAKANRSLVLWMINPERHQNEAASDDIYTCPDYTRGSYYSGPTRVSLINTAANEVINTVEVAAEGDESFDVPYAIRKGFYYHVAAATETGVEARPTIIWLRDYNGDGAALEFALFNAQACMGLDTTLIGYSKLQDRVIQYPVHLRTIDGKKSSAETVFWADYLFSKKARAPGRWKYEVDYRGRGGSLDRWTVQYNATKEEFEATVIHIADQSAIETEPLLLVSQQQTEAEGCQC
jgi:hypothetical protein